MIFPEHTAWKAPRRHAAGGWTAVAAALLMVCCWAAGARGEPPTAAGADDGRIEISADRLSVDNKAHSAVFSGRVTAVQGSQRITADRITVFYAPPEGDAAAAPGGEAAIRRIVSEGNVTIHFDDKVAVTRKAVYDKAAGVLALIGENTRVTSGQNTITGDRITVDRARDTITVEGGGDTRVEAVIFPDQAGGGLLPPAQSDGQPTP